LKKIFLAGVAAAYWCAPALAAPPYQAVPAAYNWTGCYVGGNVGYSSGQSKINVPDDPFGGFPSQTLRTDGVIGGLQGGCNVQPSRNWVWGLETDFQWSGQKGAHEQMVAGGTVPGVITSSLIDTTGTKLRWLGTLRSRVGFVADGMPNVLWYGTGGLAYAEVRTSMIENSFEFFFPPVNVTETHVLSAAENKMKYGLAVGVGAEAALGNNWTWKIEYLYVDLGSIHGTSSWSGQFCVNGACSPTPATGGYSNKMIDNIVRVGFNYRFGDPR